MAEQEEYFEHERDEMLAFVPDNLNTILDVGCSSGNFGNLLKKKHNAEVWGIELDEGAASQAKDKLDKVFNSPVEKALPECPENTFDLVCFNDVLEHLVEPEQVLLDIKSKLKDNGVILFSIPNMRYYKVLLDLFFKKKWEYQDEGILDRTHLRFYTFKSILNMMKRLDYEVLRFEGLGVTRSFKYKLLNLLTLGTSSDAKYVKFVCLAKPKT
jgi:2-polyprenyl-3-methyl-5-hydroxy-6-metoxy-1,4-benzoquinol methylase